MGSICNIYEQIATYSFTNSTAKATKRTKIKLVAAFSFMAEIRFDAVRNHLLWWLWSYLTRISFIKHKVSKTQGVP